MRLSPSLAMIGKIVTVVEVAVASVRDGAAVMIDGFGGALPKASLSVPISTSMAAPSRSLPGKVCSSATALRSRSKPSSRRQVGLLEVRNHLVFQGRRLACRPSLPGLAGRRRCFRPGRLCAAGLGKCHHHRLASVSIPAASSALPTRRQHHRRRLIPMAPGTTAALNCCWG